MQAMEPIKFLKSFLLVLKRIALWIYEAMDAVRKSLAEAYHFRQEERPAEAYFKHLEAVLLALQLLAQSSLFRGQDDLESATVARIFSICEQSLEKAKEELGHVLDLDERQAEECSHAGIIFTEPIRPSSDEAFPTVGLNLHRPDPYKRVDVETTTTSGDQVPAKGIFPVEEDDVYGPEGELSMRDEATVPLIPVSSLSLNLCQTLYDLQIYSQSLESFANANAKQRANALYLSGLIELTGQIKGVTRKKRTLLESIEKADKMRIRDIPAADLARQITLIQMQLFVRIAPEQLSIPVNQRSFLAPKLLDMTNLSMYLAHWCQFEILRYKKAEDRELVLGHLVRVAVNLEEMANFEGVKALISGMTAVPIRRLACVSTLGRHLRNKLDSLDLLVSERRNYAQMRDRLAKATTPCLPLLSLLYQDGSRLAEFQGSAYEQIFPFSPLIQHYLLSQPFRWEEELFSTSKLREPRGRVLGVAVGDQLTDKELERLSLAESDHYDRLGLGLRDSYVRANNGGFNSPVSSRGSSSYIR